MLPAGVWKSLIFQVLVLLKEIMTGNLSGRVASWRLEKPDISGVGSSERNYDGKLERSCRLSA